MCKRVIKKKKKSGLLSLLSDSRILQFGNKQFAINRHMDILLNLEPVTSKYNLRGLRTFCDTVESHIRALKSLGVRSHSYGSLNAVFH